jgi:hypothetical protein
VTDHVILGRVHKTKAKDKAAYEFFCGCSAGNKPFGTNDLDQYKPVLPIPDAVTEYLLITTKVLIVISWFPPAAAV